MKTSLGILIIFGAAFLAFVYDVSKFISYNGDVYIADLKTMDAPENAASEKYKELRFWRTPLPTLLDQELPLFSEEELAYLKSQVVVAEDIVTDPLVNAPLRKWHLYNKTTLTEDNFIKRIIFEIKEMRKSK